MTKSAVTEKQIIAALKRKGGKTRTELKATPYQLRKLVEAGIVTTREARRQTGKRGRPAIEYDLAA